MTTHRPQQTPITAAAKPIPVTPVRGDRAGATVPVNVWRTIPDEPDVSAHDSGLTALLAHHLVAIYTAVGDTIVDFDADDKLCDAAQASARRYVSASSPGELAGQHLEPQQPITLIVMRWPRPSAGTPTEARAILTACQEILDSGGSVIIAVTAAAARHPGTTYTEYEHQLVPTAKAVGLRHLHDIVPLTATDGRDAFTYPATDHDLNNPDRDTDADTPGHTAATTLIIFDKAVGRS